MGRKIAAVVAGVASAFLLYAVFVVAAVAAAIVNGEGIGCRDAECGAVSNFLDDVSPWLPIAVALLAVGVGLFIARRLWPATTQLARGPARSHTRRGPRRR